MREEGDRSRKKTTPRRWVQIGLRTVHIASFSVLVGGHVFAVEADSLRPWLYAAIASGGALVVSQLDIGWLWFRQLRGVAIAVKLGLLGIIPFWWSARVPLLVAIIVISSLSSHMPGRYRYWVVGRGPP